VDVARQNHKQIEQLNQADAQAVRRKTLAFYAAERRS
jgi:hypothetical protein